MLSLDPPSSVTLAIAGNRIVAQGSAPRPWLDRAHAVAQMLPAGSPGFDLAGVANEDEAAEQSRQVMDRQWQAYVQRLRTEPGIVITQAEVARRQVHRVGHARSARRRPAYAAGRDGNRSGAGRGAVRSVSGARPAIRARAAGGVAQPRRPA